MPQMLCGLRLVSLALVLVVLTACGGRAPEPGKAPRPPSPVDSPKAELTKPPEVTITADALRVTLNNMLREHVFFVTAATGAVLAGNTDGFEAAVKTLKDGTAVEFADLLGNIHGRQARESFLKLWNAHIDAVVAYANALAKNDQAAQAKATTDLNQHTKNFSAELEKMTGLPASTAEPLIAAHIETLKRVIDKQKAGDVTGAYTDLRIAMAHLDTVAKPLAAQIAKQKHFAGTVDSKAADLQTELNRLLQEHVFLAGAATRAALSGDTASFGAATKAKEGNSTDLANMMSAMYGRDAGKMFLGLWNSHLDMLMAYTNGLANNDKVVQHKAVTDLTNYVSSLASALENVTQGSLPATASSSLLQQHVIKLKTAVDLQKSGSSSTAYTELRNAAHQMRMIADLLAQAIVKQKGIG